MSERNALEIVENQWSLENFVSVGLDSADEERMLTVIDETHDLACAFKFNSEPYFKEGAPGFEMLQGNIAHAQSVAPKVLKIFDRKPGDIGDTNTNTAEMAFDRLKVDAITVNPYAGGEAFTPFTDHVDKLTFFLCHTSNPGAEEFQDLLVRVPPDALEHMEALLEREIPEGLAPLYQYVAYRVAHRWNKNRNCGLVMGATYIEQLRDVRKIVGVIPILIPAVGFQQKGIPLEVQVRLVVENGKDSLGKGIIVNSARGIIFAPNPRQATLMLRTFINQYL